MKIKNDNKSLAIFVLAVALVGVALNWVAAACFAAGWMIRQYMWVKHITKVLPDLVKAEVTKLLAGPSKNNKLN